MSTPMFDMPEHLAIGVTVDGQGPVPSWDPAFDHVACWCGKPGCREYESTDRDAS